MIKRLSSVLLLTLTSTFAADLQVNWHNDYDATLVGAPFFFDLRPLVNNSNISLEIGDRVELGYFDNTLAASQAYIGSYNEFVVIEAASIGDDDGNAPFGGTLNSPGEFNKKSIFKVTDNIGLGTNHRLAIRFYDDSLVTANSTRYNMVTYDGWKWIAPTSDTGIANSITLQMSGGSIGDFIWAGGAGSEFKTTELVPVPEPSTYAAIMGLMTLGFVVWQRRRRKARA